VRSYSNDGSDCVKPTELSADKHEKTSMSVVTVDMILPFSSAAMRAATGALGADAEEGPERRIKATSAIVARVRDQAADRQL
jgi:hypothetical protein